MRDALALTLVVVVVVDVVLYARILIRLRSLEDFVRRNVRGEY